MNSLANSIKKEHLTDETAATIRPEDCGTDFVIKVSEQVSDAQWDQFVRETPAGHHVQSSLWASLKKVDNWAPVRVTLSTPDGTILAGAQFLTKRLPLMGRLAYLPDGPVISRPDVTDFDCVRRMLDEGMRKAGVIMAMIVPPRNRQDFAEYLERKGLNAHTMPAVLGATTLIDLYQDEDTILSRMKSKTRYNIRYAERNGIVVRAGNRDDLPLFHQLLQKTGERKEFHPSPLDYFERFYGVFSPHNNIRLLFAEHENEVVASILLIPFGDTVIYKRGGWGGEKGNLRPNEALHWAAITWAKEQGYHYYDFDGILVEMARAVLADEPLPDHAIDHHSRFKIGFGGEILMLPGVYLYSRYALINKLAQQTEWVKAGMKWAKRLRR